MTIEVGEQLHGWLVHLVPAGSVTYRDIEISLGLLFSVLLCRLALQKIVTTVLTFRALAFAPSISRRICRRARCC